MNKIRTIIRKEWLEVFKNRLVIFTVAFLPLLMAVIPLGVFYVIGLGVVLMGRSFHYNLPAVYLLLLLPIFFIPLVHLFVSTSRMKRAAAAVPTPAAAPPLDADGPPPPPEG